MVKTKKPTVRMPNPANDAPPKRVNRRSRQAELRALKMRQDVATLYLKGYSQTEVSTLLDINQSTVSKVITQIRDAWKLNSKSAIEERKMIELARIDWIERQAQEAWEASQKDLIKEVNRSELYAKEVPVTKSKNGNKQKVVGKLVPELKMVPVKEFIERQKTKQVGNPAFLDRVAWCIEMRLKLFGILDDKKVEMTVNQIAWDGLHSKPKPPAQLDSVEAKLKQVEREAEMARIPDAEIMTPTDDHFPR